LLNNAIAGFYAGILCNLYVSTYVMLKTNVQCITGSILLAKFAKLIVHEDQLLTWGSFV